MEMTLMNLIQINTIYHQNHRITKADVLKANELIKRIEETRDQTKPCAGDVIICVGPHKTYENGHLEYWDASACNSICVQPYVPFVHLYLGNLSFSSSGGYWFNIKEEDTDMFEYHGAKEKLFQEWGHCGPCSGGAFLFKAKVNVWKIFKESIY